MTTKQAQEKFNEIKEYYDLIPSPKYRHADLNTLKEKFEQLQNLKVDLVKDTSYRKLVNAISQIIAKLEKRHKKREWWNLSERGTNRVIPAISKNNGQSWPVEYEDIWGNTCHISNGHWGAKNHIVMDVIGNMFLLKEGGDCLPKNAEPIFNDLFEIQSLEKHLNGNSESVIPVRRRHSIRFTDEHFRQYTDLRMNSNEIKALLLETSRVEFKLTFPVRLKSTGAKENTHRMNYYSRFFELGHEDLSVKRNGVVLSRRYTVVFSTLLGELFANNLLAKFNDRIDNRFYQLPNSAQIFYRKALIHNDIKRIPFNLATIANYAGLADSNPWNLSTTVEINILKPLIEYGYIDSYEKEGENPKAPKTIIHRFGSKKIG